ncbi:MAG: cyclopropane-fatty-acyl-phospholipid synthase family protein, partial [Gammaproteobacteria bacterium]
MPRDADEKALFERFSKKYDLIGADLLKQIERSNCGCDYGSTSFTTLKQVEELGAMLGLGPNKRLLEVGAGAGWPGLYLARESGCDVTLTDLPLEGLRKAKERAKLERLSGACAVAVASGSALPFRESWFDAISHADVLCCLVDKLSVLNACRDVVRADGRMVFSAVLISPELSEADCRQAVENGPSFMAAKDSYPNMLEAAGWELVDHTNLSTEFLETLRVMLDNELHHADD